MCYPLTLIVNSVVCYHAVYSKGELIHVQAPILEVSLRVVRERGNKEQRAKERDGVAIAM